MYSSCIFCNHALGRNEAVEHFPVGRRLAFDSARGRLWAVCRRCKRWNLTPLETRWEALEEAERLFRSARLRASTDNIGMAQLSEGLQLVRIGAPPQLELAGWRYGDHFGKRRRKYFLYGSLGLGALAAQAVGSALGLGLLGIGAAVTLQTFNNVAMRRRARVPVAVLRSQDGRKLLLTQDDAAMVALQVNAITGELQLRLRPSEPIAPSGWTEKAWPNTATRPSKVRENLTGDAALRALATILPHTNESGGSERQVRSAVDVIREMPALDALLRRAATIRSYNNAVPGENRIGGLQPELRLALEMTVHSDDERRAMEGELHELELRWKEAEEIAAIADSLLLPPDIDARMDELRARERDNTQ